MHGEGIDPAVPRYPLGAVVFDNETIQFLNSDQDELGSSYGWVRNVEGTNVPLPHKTCHRPTADAKKCSSYLLADCLIRLPFHSCFKRHLVSTLTSIS